MSIDRKVRIRGEPLGETMEALLPDEHRADAALLEEDRAAMLRRALLALPEMERTILSMHYFDGLLLREIGQVFGVSESRVCQIRRQALGRLRRRLRDAC